MKKSFGECRKKKYIKLKRLIDISLALLMFCVTWPVMLAVAFAIKCIDPGPVIYKQKRPGYKGKPFYIYKFRTMKTEAWRVTEDGKKVRIPDHERITGAGSFLRKTSLDELPQLINIINGEMSFIGPRPLLMKYLGRYSEEQMRRHDVLPGISGLAQVMGRNEIEWEEKFKHDVWYVDNICLMLDLKILFLTVKNVVKGTGVNRSESETMPFFEGNRKK